MTVVTNPCDLAGLAAHLAPYATMRTIGLVRCAECYADGALHFFGPVEDGEPLLAVVHANGAVETLLGAP